MLKMAALAPMAIANVSTAMPVNIGIRTRRRTTWRMRINGLDVMRWVRVALPGCLRSSRARERVLVAALTCMHQLKTPIAADEHGFLEDGLACFVLWPRPSERSMSEQTGG